MLPRSWVKTCKQLAVAQSPSTGDYAHISGIVQQTETDVQWTPMLSWIGHAVDRDPYTPAGHI